MKILIIYNSVSGYTEKYALALKERLGEEADAVPLSKFKPKSLAPYDRAVFMTRVINNTLAGFKTVVKHAALFAEKYTCIVGVGMAEPNAAQYHNLEESNIPYLLKGIPFFVLRGGFDFSRLKGMDKFMIKTVRSRLERAPSRSREDMAVLNFLAAVTDKTDLSSLAPIEEYLKTGIFTPPEKPDESAPFWIDLGTDGEGKDETNGETQAETGEREEKDESAGNADKSETAAQ